jgi:uncharacterized phage infection (PIP) family protein YhgE
MAQLETTIHQLQVKEDRLNRQSKHFIGIIIGTLLVVFFGISILVWNFANGMSGVVDDINELTTNLGYTQGILNGMSARVGAISGSVESVPRMVDLMKNFNEKLPLFVDDIASIEQELSGFQNSMFRLDTSLTGINGSMSHLNFEIRLMSENTKNFARVMP